MNQRVHHVKRLEKGGTREETQKEQPASKEERKLEQYGLLKAKQEFQ